MKTIILVIVVLIIGYLIGTFFPFNLASEDKGIAGETEVEVTIQMNSGSPLSNIEVDMATAPGAPPVGGVSLTDANGIARFSVKPGNYFIFFNSLNFPNNLKDPGSLSLEVKEGLVNKTTIILETK